MLTTDDDMLSANGDLSLPHVDKVPETQLRMSQSRQMPVGDSSSLSVLHAHAGLQSLAPSALGSQPHPEVRSHEGKRAPDLHPMGGNRSCNLSQGSPPLSQDEREQFAFKRPPAHPNSGSRRTPLNEIRGEHSRINQNSQHATEAESQAGRSMGERRTCGVPSKESGPSSSPDFVHAAHRRKSSTYHHPQSRAGSHRSPTSQTVDPRLVVREAQIMNKRKASALPVEETDRNVKRLPSVGTDGRKTIGSRMNLRSQTQAQASVRDLPTIASARGGSQASRQSSSSQSRVRNLAGGNPRARGGRKQTTSKFCPRAGLRIYFDSDIIGDEINACFAQNLGRS